MHRLIFLLLSFIPLFLTACKGNDEAPVKQVARPVKTVLVSAADGGGIRNFPGVVDAGQRADISFRVKGKLNKLLVKEGDDVAKGQVLAKLDSTDFQIVVNDKQASFARARADFSRAKKLVAKGHISRMDFDRLEANYKSRLADLNKAKRDLSYTVLKAPFAGTIAQRMVDNFEEVRSSQVVFALRDNSELEVKVNVPENIMLKIKPRKENDQNDIPVWASFDQVGNKRFPLTVKEVAAKADAKTQTFLVTFSMPPPPGLTVLPGMTVTVSAELAGRLGQKTTIYYLPVSAVTGNAQLQSRIWVVDEKDMTVQPKKVTLGVMRGNQIEILQGLQGNERVVTAGAGYMAKGMKVTLIADHEQAEPRPEDVRLSIGL